MARIMMSLSLVVASALVIGWLSLGERADRYPLLVDERGRVVDPYLQREAKNTITANAREIQICYNRLVTRRQDDPTVRVDGPLHLDWRVTARGRVEDLRVITSSFTDPVFQACVLETIAAWRFPPPGQSRYVEHTFTFAQQQ